MDGHDNHTRLPNDGLFLGRARSPQAAHPLVVTVRDGVVFDITSKQAPTTRDICEMDDPAGYVRAAQGKPLGDLSATSPPTPCRARAMRQNRRCSRRSTCRR